ncbi:MAG: D-alanyl-D-alanine carboxypeptidase family protein [Limnochordia bacterium]|jgi:D-alanyl-D-alanine carboxypeptidase (penicillin-binding protein 5/6)
MDWCKPLAGLLLCLLIAGMGFAQELNVSAPSAVLMEATSGRVLYQKEPHRRQPVASLVKIMTLTLALEELASGRLRMEDPIVASPYASSMGGSQIWWEAGEHMPLKDALYAIAVGSANDASVALAEFMTGSEDAFVQRMNERASQLGLQDTHFVNSNGLPTKKGEHYSTAQDIANLSRHALAVPLLMELVSTYHYVIRPGRKNEVVLWNYNRMLDRTMSETGRSYGYPGLDGIKTGSTTEAGYCLAATAERADLRLISVVLGAESSAKREEDIRTLLDYGFRTYRAEVIAQKDEILGEAKVRRGKTEQVPIVAAQSLKVAVPRAAGGRIERQLLLEKDLIAPLAKQQIIGTLIALYEGEELGRIDLVAGEDVPRGSLWQIIRGTGRDLLHSLFSNKG